MTSSSDCKALADASESLTQNLLDSASTTLGPRLWIFMFAFMSTITLLRLTLLPCTTLHGLDQTIKAVEKMLQGHMGAGIIPFNIDSGTDDTCFASGRGHSDNHLFRGNQWVFAIFHSFWTIILFYAHRYLDNQDLEHSRRWVCFSLPEFSSWRSILGVWTMKNVYVGQYIPEIFYILLELSCNLSYLLA